MLAGFIILNGSLLMGILITNYFKEPVQKSFAEVGIELSEGEAQLVIVGGIMIFILIGGIMYYAGRSLTYEEIASIWKKGPEYITIELPHGWKSSDEINYLYGLIINDNKKLYYIKNILETEEAADTITELIERGYVCINTLVCSDELLIYFLSHMKWVLIILLLKKLIKAYQKFILNR